MLPVNMLHGTEVQFSPNSKQDQNSAQADESPQGRTLESAALLNLNLTSPLCRKWSWKSLLPPNDVCETSSGTIALNQLATKTNFITADSNEHKVSFSKCPSALMEWSIYGPCSRTPCPCRSCPRSCKSSISPPHDISGFFLLLPLAMALRVSTVKKFRKQI